MAHSFSETTTQSWLSRLMGSVGGVVVGLMLVLGSFALLWMNEGRTDLSKIADRSRAIVADSVDAANEGQLVAATGTLTTDVPLGDTTLLAPGPYIRLERTVEMFAWVEQRDSTTKRNTGGSQTTTTTYSYRTEWTSSPSSGDSFKEPAGHTNPALPLQSEHFTASGAHLGAFAVDLNRIGLPALEDITLSAQDVAPKSDAHLSGEYLLLGNASLKNPRVGDTRVRYRAVPSGIQVTGFGTQQGSQLVPYTAGEAQLYTIARGDRDSAIAAMRSAFKTAGWLGRLGGFLMMWIGLTLFTGPISTFLDVLPILGNLSRTTLGILTFGIAATLSLVTILIAMVAHNIFLLVALLAVLLGVVWFIGQRRRKSLAPATA